MKSPLICHFCAWKRSTWYYHTVKVDEICTYKTVQLMDGDIPELLCAEKSKQMVKCVCCFAICQEPLHTVKKKNYIITEITNVLDCASF